MFKDLYTAFPYCFSSIQAFGEETDGQNSNLLIPAHVLKLQQPPTNTQLLNMYVKFIELYLEQMVFEQFLNDDWDEKLVILIKNDLNARVLNYSKIVPYNR